MSLARRAAGPCADGGHRLRASCAVIRLLLPLLRPRYGLRRGVPGFGALGI